ncbi:Uncharacterised protein [Mycobacteroides abscessus]|nr:hypothetical protein DDJ68_22200 [Mycobacteroides abscessus]SIA56381.1 Uncharacterised protein [Mycobacteroides abscessus subsp. abscessus]RIR99525.1 hypothetical protein D2E57_02490 [Mycobacteroides abscessus]CPR89962.1 Uncharacterised protein [Mycobacteroides abscessus]CPU82552.1 Uncharacterised protein [Mycobacteroides abscessus]
MAWFYVDDGFSDSKPIMNLPTTPVRVPMRIAVAGAWVLGGSWSAKEETDGYIPHAKLKSLLVPRSVVAALTAPGPLDAPLCCPESDGILVRNWAKWQRTKAENEANRKREAEKKRNQRRRGRNFVTGIDDQMSPGDNGGDTAEPGENVSPGESRGPTPPHPLVVTSSGDSPVGSRPAEHCPQHPGGTEQPCGACANARRNANTWDAQQLQAAADQRAAMLAAIHACPDCDPNGLRYSDPEDPESPLIRCTHPRLENTA